MSTPAAVAALPPVDEILSHLYVRDIMTTDVHSVRPSTPVSELVTLLVERHVSGVPVVDDDVAIGVVSATDVLRLSAFAVEPADERQDYDEPEAERAAFFLESDGIRRLRAANVPHTALDGWTVADIMTPMTFTVRPDASLPELARLLFRSQIHRALVTRGTDLLGIVTSFDIVRALAAAEDG